METDEGRGGERETDEKCCLIRDELRPTGGRRMKRERGFKNINQIRSGEQRHDGEKKERMEDGMNEIHRKTGEKESRI